MPQGTRTHLTTPFGPELTLPPPFTAVRLRERGDAFAHAMSTADEEGAGTLVYVGRFDLAEFALVIEPDEPLVGARRVFYAGMASLADALAVHAQPETMITIEWPDAIFINGGLVGGGRLGWPQGASEETTPEWLVFGATIRAASMTGQEPGLHPSSTALDEEGFADVLSGQLVESFARHFMVAVDGWQEQGFAPVAKSYLQYLAPEKGTRREINDNGDLLVRRAGASEWQGRPLLPALLALSWLDPETREPRL